MSVHTVPTRPAPAAQLIASAIRHGRVRAYASSRQQHGHGAFRCARRTLEDYNLIHVTRGRPVWLIDGEPAPLHPGDLLIVPRGVPHEAHSGRTRRVTLLSLHVRFDLPGGRDLFAMLRPPRTRPVAARTRLDGYLRGALDEFDRDDKSAVKRAIDAWCGLITPELFRQDAAARRLAPEPVEPLIGDLLTMLHGRVAEPTTLDQLTALAGYSAQHMNRVFRHALGVTPLRYLHALRMQRAVQLLAAGELTVEAVARSVGFDDAFYFSRRFREAYGVSPSQYRD